MGIRVIEGSSRSRLLIVLVLCALGCKKNNITNADAPVIRDEVSQGDSVKLSIDGEETFGKLITDSASKSDFYYNWIGNFNNITKGWQGCPSIGYENGHLYISYYIGAKGEEPGNYISVSVSNDLGNTWKNDALVIAQKTNFGRVLDPCFWNDKYGALRLSWTMTESIWDGGTGGIWASKVQQDKTGNLVLSKPRKLFNGVMNVKPTPISTDSSSIIFPVSGWNITTNTLNNYPSTPTPSDQNGAFLYSSSYDKTTQKLQQPMKLCRLPNKFYRLFDEHMIVELAKNEFLCMLRTDGTGISFMKTTDGGITWSNQSVFTDLGPTTASRFYFGKLKSGNVIFVLNNSTQREKLTAFLSKDNGKTWPYKLLIDNRLGTSYPDLTQLPNNDIFMTYDYGRTFPNGNINVVKFTESDIINGDETKIFRKLVTKF